MMRLFNWSVGMSHLFLYKTNCIFSVKFINSALSLQHIMADCVKVRSENLTSIETDVFWHHDGFSFLVCRTKVWRICYITDLEKFTELSPAPHSPACRMTVRLWTPPVHFCLHLEVEQCPSLSFHFGTAACPELWTAKAKKNFENKEKRIKFIF